LKVYSLVGRKLVECSPDELLESQVGMILDEKEEMIRLVITREARKKQREYLMQQTSDFNKKEFAGTYLVSYLENPEIINAFIEEIKKIESGEVSEKPVEKPKSKSKKKRKKKKAVTEEVETETTILERWNPELVKKAVIFLDGKDFVHLHEIQEVLEVTEGESYWLTQDLIHVGIVPGRWTGYAEGQWVYQVLKEHLKSKQKPKKTSTKKPAAKKSPKKKTSAKSATKSSTKKSTKTKAKKTDSK